MDREPGPHNTPPELFTADEVARAAGVPASRVLHSSDLRRRSRGARTGRLWRRRPADAFIAFDDAVAAVRTLRQSRPPPGSGSCSRRRRHARPALPDLTMAVSGTLHAGMVACVVLVTGFGLAPEAATLGDLTQDAPAHLVFLALPGPGGGGGGGALRRPAPPPRCGTRRAPRRQQPDPGASRTPVPPSTPRRTCRRSRRNRFPPAIAPIVVLAEGRP